MRGFDLRAAAFLALLVWVAYGSTANLAFISDDYVYLVKAREYAAPADWGALFRDELYRSRATTIWITAGLEHIFGLKPTFYNLLSVIVHMVNVLLVYALGRWRLIGWPVALVAASFFAIAERPHEAIMWYSALPDLLAFTFSLTAVHGYLGWLDGRRAWSWMAYSGTVASFLLGLLSKESAAAALAFLALVLLFDARAKRIHWMALVPLAALTVVYTLLIFKAGPSHLHLRDGTFTPGWHAAGVLLSSYARLLWVWGIAAALLIGLLKPTTPQIWRTVGFGLLWMIPALAPYSFLSYMGTVPSRHTYLANLGVALLVGAAGYLVYTSWIKNHPWAVAALAIALFLHNTGYIWLVKKPAFVTRSMYTEQLIDQAMHTSASPLRISADTFPFNLELAHDAILIRTGQDRDVQFIE
jgi:hypothetical protein